MTPGVLDEHRKRIEAFAAELIEPYLDRMAAGPRRSTTAKEFNDPVWGTVHVRAEEVFILDSPLLQRLRRIRQLGVVHYVYPSATHTRLEHSLGTLHQVQRLITSINEAGPVRADEGTFSDSDAQAISGDLERALRIAALCHDVGHGAMSHVSEYALTDDRGSEDLRLAFQRETNSSAVKQLSEIAAYYILGSPAFTRLTSAAAHAANKAEILGLCGVLQQLVAGRRIDDEHVLIHELISGPFDADKLDYVARDATMCGVPVVTDVHRLIQKVRATNVESKNLPARLKGRVQARAGGHQLIGIARSGGRSLDELALARALMFDKVYRHQKVRAVEAMVFSILEQLVALSPQHPAELILRLSDDDLLALDAARIAQLAHIALHDGDSERETDEKTRVATDLSRRLRDRELFVRGYAFSAVMTGDTYRTDPDHVAGISEFMTACAQPAARTAFMDKVREYISEIARLTDNEDVLAFPGGKLTPYVRLSPPKPAPKTQNADTGHAHLIDTDGRITQVQDDAAETMPWADAYIATRDLGHIYCPEPLAPLVFIAAETALSEDYSVHTPESMLMYAKQSRSRIEELKRKLGAAGWFDGKPASLRPLPDVLTRADAEDRLEAIVRRLAGYSGPTQALAAGSADQAPATIHREQVLAFVLQFPDHLVSAALTMLNSIYVIGRPEMNKALDTFMRENPQFRGASCTGLGEAKDSSAVVTYYVGDIARSHGMKLTGLADALLASGPIVFVDDFIGTGNQLIDIVEAYLDAERTTDLGEERRSLGLHAQLLKDREVAFVFAVGTRNGIERAQDRLGELGLRATVYSLTTDDALPTIAGLGLGTDELDQLIGFVRTKALSALADYAGRPRDPSWIDGKTLGYGNRGLLITSAFNTPTATLTALWIEKPGVWRPLLRRRRKD